MKKFVLLCCISTFFCGCGSLKNYRLIHQKQIYSVAHRGCAIDGIIPENSLAAIEYAHRYGYSAVECDPKYTSDSVLILQHDLTLNRCAHYKSSYAPVIEKTFIEDLNFKELRENYVLSSSVPSQRVPIPTLNEFLQTCQKYHILPMVHSDVYSILEKACEETKGNFIAFGTNYETLQRIRKISDCLILWDPGNLPAKEVVHQLQQIGGRCGVSSMNWKLLSTDYIQTLHKAGFLVQSSIVPAPHEMQCIHHGADMLLSDFHLTAPSSTHSWKTEKINEKLLPKGENLNYTFDSTTCGSIEIQLKFKGNIDIVVNNKYTYHLKNQKNNIKEQRGGWRFYHQTATVNITACEDTKIQTLKMKVYRY